MDFNTSAFETAVSVCLITPVTGLCAVAVVKATDQEYEPAVFPTAKVHVLEPAVNVLAESHVAPVAVKPEVTDITRPGIVLPVGIGLPLISFALIVRVAKSPAVYTALSNDAVNVCVVVDATVTL